MGAESPNVILYDVNGQEMSVSNGSAIPAGTSALMIAGSDGTNSRFLLLDSSARQIVAGAGVAGTPTGGVISIQGVSGGQAVPISGSITAVLADVTAGTFLLNNVGLTANITLSGTYGAGMQLLAGTLVGTISAEISYDGGTTWVGSFFDDPTTGNKVSSIVFGSSNTATSRTIVAPAGASNARARVSAYTSGTANCNMRATVVVEPPVLFSGPAGGTLPPTIAQIGGSVTTAAPTYSTGTVNALSLNTSGGLRVDGSGVIQPVSQSSGPWTQNLTQVGSSAVTTLAAGEQKVAVEGLAASGSATSGNPVLIAGSDGTDARSIRTDTVGYVQIISNQFSTTTTTNTIFAQVTPSSSSTATVVRKTAYTEQTANFTGSVSSSSANDTSAGTGARTVTITYYDQTGAGPNTETATLNGTTPVNLVNANHCFIEKIVIATAGSTGSNVGIISLFTGAAGAGTLVGTIAATDNQTFWAHHYIPSGKTNYLTQILMGTTGNQTTYFYMTKKSVLVANAIEYQLTDKIINASGTDTATRIYYSPLQTAGFSRITMYIVSNGNNTTYFGSFDYGDQ